MLTGHELLTRRALRIATALTDAAARGDDETMQRILHQLNGDPAPAGGETLATVLSMASSAFGTSPRDIKGDLRNRHILDARHVTFYAGYLLGFTYSGLGKALGKDHTTVMNGCSRVATTPRLRGVATTIAERLGWDREATA